MQKKETTNTRPWYRKKRYLIPIFAIGILIILIFFGIFTPGQIGKFILILLICWATEPIVEKLFR